MANIKSKYGIITQIFYESINISDFHVKDTTDYGNYMEKEYILTLNNDYNMSSCRDKLKRKIGSELSQIYHENIFEIYCDRQKNRNNAENKLSINIKIAK